MNPEDERVNPEELLKAIKKEELKTKKGKLKIFLGMAAGVGKTYAMLEEAQRLKQDGVDVVVGVINTHGRQDTANLLTGLKVIPEKKMVYRDVALTEFDIDKVLELKPKVVLVDELAHSNVPNSRHPKRWQDIMELLDNGIDVYTTLNVQHIESLKDVIEGITGVAIRETVPDLMIDTADSIELIDLTPTELLKRLKEGKVYLGDKSEIAARHFFQEDRLTALREIILRYAAEKVDHDLHTMISQIRRSEGWRPREHLLVAVSHSPTSQRLIRITRRLSFLLDANWTAVYVNNGIPLNENDAETLEKNLNLARDLGAEVITTSDSDIASAIQRIARQKGITQIILGRSPRESLFAFLTRTTLLDRFERECSDIDLHVIRQKDTLLKPKRKLNFHLPESWTPYVITTGIALLLSGLGILILPYVRDYKFIGITYLAVILISSLFFKKGPIIFGACLIFIMWNLFLVPSEGSTITIHRQDDIILSFSLILTAILTGILTDRERKNKELLIKQEESTRALYDFVGDITSARSSEEILPTIQERIGNLLDCTCEVVIKSIDNGLRFNENSDLLKDDKEKQAAIWCIEHLQEAGWSTSTLPSAKCYFIPLKGRELTVGVFALRPNNKNSLSIEDKNFLNTVCQQLANYLERSLSEEKALKEEHERNLDKIQQTIFRVISTEFKSPLDTIQEAIQEIKRSSEMEIKERELPRIHRIEDSSEGLTHVLGNISAMAKLSGGLIPITKKHHSIKKIIDFCMASLGKAASNHDFLIVIEENLPAVYCDFSLIELLLYNIIYNAIQNSPEGSKIEVRASLIDHMISIAVLDEGKGIQPELIEVIFKKFYRLPDNSAVGLGLGLTIAKKIAELHKGFLTVENRDEGGAKFTIYIPINKKN